MRMHVSTSCATGSTAAGSGLEEDEGGDAWSYFTHASTFGFNKTRAITRKGRPNTWLSYLGLQTFAVTVKQDVTAQ